MTDKCVTVTTKFILQFVHKCLVRICYTNFFLFKFAYLYAISRNDQFDLEIDEWNEC